MAEHCRWEFKPDPDSVALARSAVAEFAVMCGFYRQVAEDIKLAVGEACSNAVEHSGSGKNFHIRCQYDDDSLVVCVEDHGRGFEPKASSGNREMLQPRGLGIYLMRSLMDSVSYQHKPGDGTQVILRKRKVPAPARAQA